MPFVPTFDDVSPAIRGALEGHGFTAFTPVQEAVLDPALADRDLRIFSQTGSGKTVAVGLAIAPALEAAVAALASGEPQKGEAKPFALVVAPTRELAQQIGRELGWLYEPIGVEVAIVTGGASYPREHAALRRRPLVLVGTPGRLIDHLSRKSVSLASLGVVVLDEADQMLDLGFKDELDSILAATPETRRTLLLSATFPREVQRLADRCQRDPIVAAGTGAGERNLDITHVAHLVLPDERDRALLNLLLMAPGERALVFVRTRESAGELADGLSDIGIPARAIHGDLEQRDRTRTLDAFRSGAVQTLVATDVAARGLDVPDVARVIHADPPNDAEVFTHRSGRTGRAGRKGTSIVLVPPQMRERVRAMLRRAGIEAAWSAAPSAKEVLAAADARLIADLTRASAVTTAEQAPEAAGEEEREDAQEKPSDRTLALADQLLAANEPRAIVAALLERVHHAGPCAPAEITPIRPPPPRVAQTSPPPAPGRGRPGRPGEGSFERGPRSFERRNHADAPRGGYADNDRGDRPERTDRAERGPQDGGNGGGGGFVPFRVTWGERHGADPRRLLALVCRRGGIRSNEVGAIRVGPVFSTVEVASNVASAFTAAAKEPDARDPRVHISPAHDAPRGAPRQESWGGPPPRKGPPRSRDEHFARPHAHAPASAPSEGDEGEPAVVPAPHKAARAHAAPPVAHAAPPVADAAPAPPAAQVPTAPAERPKRKMVTLPSSKPTKPAKSGRDGGHAPAKRRTPKS